MFDILKQAIPATKNRWKIALITSLAAFFVLAAFQPFNLNYVSDKWFRISVYSLISFASTNIVIYVFPLVFKKFYSPTEWVVWKSLLNTSLILLLIAFNNSLFSLYLSGLSISKLGQILTISLIITLLVGVFPVVLVLLYRYTHILKTNLHAARVLNQKLTKHYKQETTHDSSEKVILLSGTTKKQLSVSPNSILYIETLGNYLVISYLDKDNQYQQSQIRATIKMIETKLKAYPFLMRTHRAFIVNTNYINSIEGNLQGFSLNLKHSKETIPVSRSYTKDIREKLEA
jgi:hypothetical protein